MSYLDYLKKTFNITYTQNLSQSNRSSFSAVLDLFGTMGASRSKDTEELERYFIASWAESPELTAKSLMYLRDPRSGIGERRVFRQYIHIMLKTHPLTAIEIIKQLPEIGRFDDIIYIWHNARSQKLDTVIKDIIYTQLKTDLISDKPSLLGKWLPSENTSSKETKSIARKLISLLDMKVPQYRKTLSSLRKKIKIIENNLREKDYTFDYSAVPSLALRKYTKAFERNDSERYAHFFEEVKAGRAKINTSVLTPFDIVRGIMFPKDEIDADKREHIDIAWKNLPNIFDGNTLNAIVACDVSGSMNGEPIICSVSLAIYIAQQNKGFFRNHFIDFCGQSRIHNISKIGNICDIISYVCCSSLDMSTNIDSVFDTLLKSAYDFKIKQNELPKYIIIISDMEFNDCGGNQTNFESWNKKFKKAGYKLPIIVFWNVNSMHTLMPATKTDNVLFLSGRSQNILKALINIDKYDLRNQSEIAMMTVTEALKDYKIEILD